MTEAPSSAETIRFPVAGMTCGSCVNRITGALQKLDGVTRVRVDLRHETATVRREPALVSNTALAAAVAGAGYTADLANLTTVPRDENRGFIHRLLGAIR